MQCFVLCGLYRLHTQCEVLLNSLLSLKVCSRDALLDAWSLQPQCKNTVSNVFVYLYLLCVCAQTY